MAFVGLLLAKQDLEGVERAVSSLERGGSSDPATYGSILRRCGKARALAQGRRVHAHMLKHKLCDDEYLANLLLHMYGKCGSLEDACALFGKMSKNQMSWNIMIQVYAHNRHLQRARDLFDEMPQRDVGSWTAMLVAYSHNRRLADAKSIFDRMPSPTVVSWNAMLSAYIKNGKPEQALRLLAKMDLQSQEPDKVTFIAAFDACGVLQARLVGEALHQDCLHTGFGDNVAVITALVDMYTKLLEMNTARRLFDSVSTPDAVLWAAMISAYAQVGHAAEARELFDRMPEKMSSSVSWTIMITAYGRAGQPEAAKELFDRMPSKGIVCWNAVITAYAQTGHHAQTFRLFQLMDLEGYHPDSVTFTAVIIDSCSDLAHGRLVHSLLKESGDVANKNIAVETALVSMYGSCGQLQDARLIFDKVQYQDVKLWSAMISAYAHNGYLDQAVHLFQLMQLLGWRPNHVTFVSVLAVCGHAGLLRDSYDHFVSLISDYGLQPQLDHYLCIVDVLGRSGRVGEAEELMTTMPYQPDAAAWTCLLSAFTAAGDSSSSAGAHQAAQTVQHLDPETSAPYTLLANLHKRHRLRT